MSRLSGSHVHLKGPPVSTKQSSSVIAMEYANADPTFATKTNVRSFTCHSFTPPEVGAEVTHSGSNRLSL